MRGDKNIVTFQEFLETHIVVDYIWEIFKGISPTIIALITIAINTKINKRKENRDRKEKELKELQVKNSWFNSLRCQKNGADVLQVIQNAGNKDVQKCFLRYMRKKIHRCLSLQGSIRPMRRYDC